MPSPQFRLKLRYERLPRLLLGKKLRELIALLLIPALSITIWFAVRSSEASLAIDVAVTSVAIVATEFAIGIWQRASKSRDELAEDFRKYHESLGLDIKDDHPWSEGMRSRMSERMEIQREHREMRSALRSSARLAQSHRNSSGSFWKIAILAIGLALVSLRRRPDIGSSRRSLR